MKTSHQTLLLLAFLSLAILPASAFYNPSTGRWLSRDPLLEKSFAFYLDIDASAVAFEKADYTCLGNSLIGRTDFLGLKLNFSKKCSPADQAQIVNDLNVRCKSAKANNCFRCLSKAGKNALDDICSGKNSPTIYCDTSSTYSKCDGTRCGRTDVLGNVRLCMDQIQKDPNCGGLGCTLIHESGHAVGGVGEDPVPPPASGKGDYRSYAIEKCMGCPIPANLPLPKGY
jgi:hypothetical protein